MKFCPEHIFHPRLANPELAYVSVSDGMICETGTYQGKPKLKGKRHVLFHPVSGDVYRGR